MISDVVRVLIPAGTAFVVGVALTPILAHYLYKYKAWKKASGKVAYGGGHAQEFNRLHRTHEIRAPRMGGVIVWASTLITILIFAIAARVFNIEFFEAFNYLSRSQTWVPLSALLVGAIAGFIDDWLIIRPSGSGLKLRYRLIIVVALSLVIGIWFYDKLDVHAVRIPFDGPLELGILIIPFFVLISLALFASGVIDGIDGLSGGVFASVFASYAIIAFAQNQIDLSAFAATVCGGLLAFLWFNIPPARFYMSDTGTMALTLVIPVIAFMTDDLGEGIGVAVLPIIGMLLVLTVASDIVQLVWKAAFGKKFFRIAPLHHHFEALGWPGEKVTMRYWILSIVFAFLGVIVALIGR
jgi:phospho-N-acetylmuramoyl-pentapeptide-transferase